MDAAAKSIRKTVQSFDWERWLERPYGTFVLSLFARANSKQTMRRYGVHAEYRACLFQDDWWYESLNVTVPYAQQLKRYLRSGGSVARIARQCEKEYQRGVRMVMKANGSALPIEKRLAILRDAEAAVVPFIWLAHGFDDVYTEWLEREVSKYVAGDIAKYIGDVTLPKRQTASSKMEDAMRRGTDPKKIVDRFGWMKARTGFSEPFTLAEVRAEQRRMMKTPKPVHPRQAVPSRLRKLVAEAQEVVYLRTLRTDAIFEILYRARPIMREAARHFGMPFHQLSQYSIHDLIAGKIEAYPKTIFATDGHDFSFFRTPLIKTSETVHRDIVGTVAFQGVVRGRVRIMRVATDGEKLKPGEVLVAPMTFPSFIMAMQRAGAFVTDEGGLTCHAAIVAREMHKPCIVGTKHATRVLKDGDLVEVDAIKGIVRKV